MITVNSDQMVRVRNRVVNVLVPVVYILGPITTVCRISMPMATAEVKPKKEKFLFSKEGKTFLS